MGVHGLWELLAPVGRRVSVETLAGKKLAIDASIWMIQFMKAMRDEKGEMVRNAHILGFFRRICKLLYLRTKPVFVFDGGTPALKRRTVVARRRQRENAQAKIRKTAEKLLLNHVKEMRLKELAADLENQRQKNDIKGKRAMAEEPDMEQNKERGNDEVAKSYSQEELDEMLAASLAVEENEGFTADASTSGAGIPGDKVYNDEGGDEDEDEDEEMILPEMHGKVDPAVLAALPPSMQLDLLVQMRERLMAENRQKYQRVKKAPARFSELQIQSYLKTVAFRREIDGVQKSAVGRGIGGVQTSRIASEANREFIFSTSFTGDKEALTSVGQERIGSEQNQNPPVNLSNCAVNEVISTTRSVSMKGLNEDETGKALHHDVNTYLDERGRLRVSRVRALGIRMTRDLQRNLDLMKEIEQEKADANQKKHQETTAAKTLDDVLGNASDRIGHQDVVDQNNDGMNDEDNKTEDPAVKVGTSMEISFEDTGDEEYGNDDNNLFASLVAGDPVVDFSIDNSASFKQSFHSDSDCEWEEGVIEDKSNIVCNDNKFDSKPSLLEGGMSDEVEVEWEDGFQCRQLDTSFCTYESEKTVTKGALVEEAEFQEAIRRSLDDMIGHRPMNKPREDLELGRAEKIDSGDSNWISDHEGKGPGVEGPAMDQPLEYTRSTNIVVTNSLEPKFAPCMECSPAKSHLIQKLLDQDAGESGALAGETFVASDIVLEEQYLRRTKEQIIDTCSIGGTGHGVTKPVDTCRGEFTHNSSSAVSSSFADSLPERLPDHDLVDVQHGVFHAEIDNHSCKTAKSAKVSANDSITDADGTKELANKKMCDDLSIEKNQPMKNPAFMDVYEEHEVNEDDLEEEMLFLHKEREELGSEQRKLERNAESVSSEMFAECQELLQMFGLPYIIAPMEAEAQCAYMEFFNLVDGVVTDDSDAFLFGARSVYKNIFDDRKYVETYFTKDIENELGLNREKIISMALLLGSDYTEGVSGIGIVNAIEVVNAFPEKNGLREFREWIESPDPTILGNFDVQPGGKSKRKGSKGGETLMSSSSSNIEEISCDQNDTKVMKQIFMDKHRNVSKNWHIPSSFPSDAVISAYTSPQVDKSTEPFSWGKPDLFILRKLCWEKFGWGSSKADELLLPVLKEYNKHETQLRLEAFYTFNERFAKIRSKRIRKAVKGITGNKSSELLDEAIPQHSGIGKKRKVKPNEEEVNKSGISLKEPECAGTSNQIGTTEETKIERSKRGRRMEKTSQLEGSDLKQSTSIDQRLGTRKESHERRRHKGHGRGKQTRRGGRKKNARFEDAETSYDDDGSHSERAGELKFDNSEESRQVRRSGRLQKAVNYTLSDEFDDCSEGELEIGAITKDSYMEQAVGGKETDVNEVKDLGIGGELFVDETEPVNMIDTLGNSQDGNGQLTEYLHFGGGFCLDKDEDMEFGGRAPSPTKETISEKSNIFTISDYVEEEKAETGPSNLNSTTSDMQRMNDDDDSRVSSTTILNSLDHTENDSENFPVRSLRAMPNLRRKKRKT